MLSYCISAVANWTLLWRNIVCDRYIVWWIWKSTLRTEEWESTWYWWYTSRNSESTKGIRASTRCLRSVWIFTERPRDFTESIIIPIEKKQEAKECVDFRTISFIPCASKILLKILTWHLQAKADDFLGPDQYMYGRGAQLISQIVPEIFLEGKWGAAVVVSGLWPQWGPGANPLPWSWWRFPDTTANFCTHSYGYAEIQL